MAMAAAPLLPHAKPSGASFSRLLRNSSSLHTMKTSVWLYLVFIVFLAFIFSYNYSLSFNSCSHHSTQQFVQFKNVTQTLAPPQPQPQPPLMSSNFSDKVLNVAINGTKPDSGSGLRERERVGRPKKRKNRNRRVGVRKGIPNKTTSLNSSNEGDVGHGKGRAAAVKQPSYYIDDDLMKCDMFDGEWVRDDDSQHPLYKPGSCSDLIDEQFNCFANGRPDHAYYNLKWKPKSCTLPRLNGRHMLEILRGKRVVFVGDSLNRNMWESLICILRNSVTDPTKVYEQSGRHNFRTEASFAFVFQDYNATVELFVAPFLVQEWEAGGENGSKKETLRVDMMSRLSDKYKNADIIVFNSGHWWTHDKTSTGKDYYQEGNHVYPYLNVLEAFNKALTTWGTWVDSNVDPTKSLVFFRGYSASHFSGGQWNSGGQCDNETKPIKNEKYLTKYPEMMKILESVIGKMKTQVTYLNVTRMTEYRKDGHPSIYRNRERRSELGIQDCSHWCLPGVPDAWNEILYAQLLIRIRHREQRQNKRLG